MPDFIETLKGMPQVKGAAMTADTVRGLVDDAILDLYGKHRWPFLKTVNRSLAWVANTAVQFFPSLSRITAIRYPDSNGQNRPLLLRDDALFTRYQYDNSTTSDTWIWRDAGMSGNKLGIELYAVPTAAKILKVDAYEIPGSSDIDTLPGYFRRLVRMMVLSEIPNSGISVVNVDYSVREAIAREEDMSGEVSSVGMDDHQEAMMRDVNAPS